MATLYVENIPEDLYDALRSRARSNHRSIAAETLSVLEQSIPTKAELKRRMDLFNTARKLRKSQTAGVAGPSAEQMLREDRDR